MTRARAISWLQLHVMTSRLVPSGVETPGSKKDDLKKEESQNKGAGWQVAPLA